MTIDSVVESSLVERLRKARSRRAVIKMRFVTLKGRAGSVPILAFEGDDDKVVYSRWIGRIRHRLKYEAFVCDGKRGVAELKSILDADLGGLLLNTYFFVDRDFVDLRQFDATIDESIYMTDSYSFENYLVSTHVVDDILRDEFPLHESPHIRQQVVELFKTVYRQFTYVTGEFNWHLYLVRNLQIPLAEKVPSRLSSYAIVDLQVVRSAGVDIAEQLKVARRPTASEISEWSEEFSQLNPFARFRGKNALLFFNRWLHLLADEWVARATDLFNGCESGPVKRAELTLGGLASKSLIPQDLFTFVARIVA